jgi:hypothetical protein
MICLKNFSCDHCESESTSYVQKYIVRRSRVVPSKVRRVFTGYTFVGEQATGKDA